MLARGRPDSSCDPGSNRHVRATGSGGTHRRGAGAEPVAVPEPQRFRILCLEEDAANAGHVFSGQGDTSFGCAEYLSADETGNETAAKRRLSRTLREGM